jgi:hypothetical protein
VKSTFLFTLLALLTIAPACYAQALGGNEYIAGAALNVALRGPYVAPSWRRPLPRFVLSSGISFAYERFVDCHAWNTSGHRPWEDLRGRLIGYIATEVGIALVRRVVR